MRAREAVGVVVFILAAPALAVAQDPAAGTDIAVNERSPRWGLSAALGFGGAGGDFGDLLQKPVAGDFNLFRNTGKWRFGVGLSFTSFTMPEPLALATRGGGASAGASWESGMALYRDQRYAEAGRALGEAVVRGGKAPELHFYLGVCQLETGDAEAAAKSLEKAVKRASRLGEYRFYLAQAQLLAGRGEEALAELRRASRLPGPRAPRSRELSRRLEIVLREG